MVALIKKTPLDSIVHKNIYKQGFYTLMTRLGMLYEGVLKLGSKKDRKEFIMFLLDKYSDNNRFTCRRRKKVGPFYAIIRLKYLL